MRRAFLPVVALLAAVGLAGCSSAPAAPGRTPPVPAQAPPTSNCPAPPDTPKAAVPDIRFTPGRTLRFGSARDVGLRPGPVADIASDAARFMKQRRYPGAVVLAARDGVIVAHHAMGHALRYSDDKPTELPPERRIAMRPDTIFDIASLSKLFTSVVAVRQLELGTLSLNAPVASYLPEFGERCKDHITIRQLLTHTSGLRPDLPFHKYETRAEQRALLYSEEPRATPGRAYIYSDLNFIALQFVLEKVTGRPLDALVRDGITRPLGMTDTGYKPAGARRSRVAATENQHVPPARVDRGLVWGQVHDESAWALGGVAGHAGVFSTARDLATLAQMLLNGGRYGQARVLSEDSTRLLFTDFNRKFPEHSHGLGFELDQRRYMDRLASPVTAGHTGFTGTSLVIDPRSHAFVILLTNRVHPSREWSGVNPARRAVARDLADAIG
jgi:CubicO group peptidase (beta-lactamase class C family)